MKRVSRFPLAVGLCFAWSAAFGQDYDLIHSGMFFDRSPLTTQQSLSSDHRLRGMGGLSLAVQDPSNEIGAFTYMGFAAGLPLDHGEEGRLEAVLFSESGTLEDKSDFDTAFMGDAIESKTGAAHFFAAVPLSTAGGGRGAFALGATGEGAEGEHSQGFLTSFGLDSGKDEPGLSGLVAGYGHRSGDWVFGAGFGSVKDEFERFDGDAAGTPVFEHRTLEMADLDLSGGYVLDAGQGRQWTFLAGPVFSRGEVTMEDNTPPAIKIEADGVGFRGGVVYGGPRTRAGLYLQSTQLEGDATATSGSSVTLDSEIETAAFLSRVRHRMESAPLSFGVEWRADVVSWRLNSPSGGTLMDLEFAEGRFGVGAAWHFGDRGLVGIELASVVEVDEDNVNPADPDTNEEREGGEVVLGGEFNLSGDWWLRAGYKGRAMEEDPEGPDPALETRGGELSLGVEYKAEAFAVALTLSSAGAESDGSSAVPVDEFRHGAGTAHLAFVYRFAPLGVER